MRTAFYELPLRFAALAKKNQELPTCNMEKSIAQNIYLIITSKFNEHRFDKSYGCEIWETDFELISNENLWKDKIHSSVMLSVKRHETRLYNVTAVIDVSEDEYNFEVKNTISIKKKLVVKVNGIVTKTGIEFAFATNLYLCPLSLE